VVDGVQIHVPNSPSPSLSGPSSEVLLLLHLHQLGLGSTGARVLLWTTLRSTPETAIIVGINILLFAICCASSSRVGGLHYHLGVLLDEAYLVDCSPPGDCRAILQAQQSSSIILTKIRVHRFFCAFGLACTYPSEQVFVGHLFTLTVGIHHSKTNISVIWTLM
jgi:hypothetical protein